MKSKMTKLPVLPKVGGKGGHGLNLKGDGKGMASKKGGKSSGKQVASKF